MNRSILSNEPAIQTPLQSIKSRANQGTNLKQTVASMITIKKQMSSTLKGKSSSNRVPSTTSLKYSNQTNVTSQISKAKSVHPRQNNQSTVTSRLFKQVTELSNISQQCKTPTSKGFT